jgi:hypothetical protein
MNNLVLLAGRYEVRGRLGRGGMAEVRDGWDTRLRRPIAIKLLHPAVSVQSGVRNRFDAEAHAAAALNHPNIVAIHDSGEHDGTPFIVMERLPGETLAHEIARGPLAEQLLGHDFATAQALGLAHDWAAKVIAATGNYGEIFQRTTGKPYHLDRGLNALWTAGGVMHPLPMR